MFTSPPLPPAVPTTPPPLPVEAPVFERPPDDPPFEIAPPVPESGPTALNCAPPESSQLQPLAPNARNDASETRTQRFCVPTHITPWSVAEGAFLASMHSTKRTLMSPRRARGRSGWFGAGAVVLLVVAPIATGCSSETDSRLGSTAHVGNDAASGGPSDTGGRAPATGGASVIGGSPSSGGNGGTGNAGNGPSGGTTGGADASVDAGAGGSTGGSAGRGPMPEVDAGPPPPPYCVAPCVWELVRHCVPDLRQCITSQSANGIETLTCDPGTGWSLRSERVGPRTYRLSYSWRGSLCFSTTSFFGIGPIVEFDDAQGGAVALNLGNTTYCGVKFTDVTTASVFTDAGMTFADARVAPGVELRRGDPACAAWDAQGFPVRPPCETTEAGTCQ